MKLSILITILLLSITQLVNAFPDKNNKYYRESAKTETRRIINFVQANEHNYVRIISHVGQMLRDIDLLDNDDNAAIAMMYIAKIRSELNESQQKRFDEYLLYEKDSLLNL
jgi:hypothetical protein